MERFSLAVLPQLPYTFAMIEAKKSLGQHWLNDDAALNAMVEAASVKAGDNVLEIGPGLGSLTQKLIESGANVTALEYDESLLPALQLRFEAQKKLKVEQGDILKYDFREQPPNFKIVANIPYYLTSHLLRILSEPGPHKPAVTSLLIQKEVAERVCASPGSMGILSVAVQLAYETRLGRVVPADLFTPPPKVDSQILILNRRPQPMFGEIDNQQFMRLVKAGFSGKRKTLRNSLSAGLQLDKPAVEKLLASAKIDPGRRAQSLSLDDWHRLYLSFTA